MIAFPRSADAIARPRVTIARNVATLAIAGSYGAPAGVTPSLRLYRGAGPAATQRSVALRVSGGRYTGTLRVRQTLRRQVICHPRRAAGRDDRVHGDLRRAVPFGDAGRRAADQQLRPRRHPRAEALVENGLGPCVSSPSRTARASAGVFTDAIEAGGHELTEWQVPLGRAPPAAGAADAVIVLGGGMHRTRRSSTPRAGAAVARGPARSGRPCSASASARSSWPGRRAPRSSAPTSRRWAWLRSSAPRRAPPIRSPARCQA